MTEEPTEDVSLELAIKELTIVNITKRSEFSDQVVALIGDVILGDAVTADELKKALKDNSEVEDETE